MFQLQLLLRDGQLSFVPSLEEVQHAVLGIVDAVLQAGQSVEDLGAKVMLWYAAGSVLGELPDGTTESPKSSRPVAGAGRRACCAAHGTL